MAEYLDHKDIDELVDHHVEIIQYDLPDVETWQQYWCIDIPTDELERELIDRLEDGGWTLVDETTHDDPVFGVYSMSIWIPAEENTAMLEWEEHDNELMKSPTAMQVESEEAWRALNVRDIDMGDQHSRPL